MAEISEYSELIRTHTVPISELDDQRAAPFKWLSESIYRRKAGLKNNTVVFLIAKILNKNGNVIPLDKRTSFDLYVLGSFRSHFIPAASVASALADFYMEINVLPLIRPITKRDFAMNKKSYLNKIRGGVVIYERR